jgi:hypothetical protein
MHTRDTGDVLGKRCISGATESGDSEVSNSCKMQEENPASVEDREEVVLQIPRNPTMQWSRTIARAPPYKFPGNKEDDSA